MITEQELKEQCTPEFIKWLENLAEGFFDRQRSGEVCWFPLLVHRAVEGIKIIYSDSEKVWYNNIYGMQCFRFKNYQPKSLTHAECAMLHCLLDRFEEVKK